MPRRSSSLPASRGLLDPHRQGAARLRSVPLVGTQGRGMEHLVLIRTALLQGFLTGTALRRRSGRCLMRHGLGLLSPSQSALEGLARGFRCQAFLPLDHPAQTSGMIGMRATKGEGVSSGPHALSTDGRQRLGLSDSRLTTAKNRLLRFQARSSGTPNLNRTSGNKGRSLTSP